MAWSYSAWQTLTATAAITAVSIAAATFTVAADQTAQVRVGDRLVVDTGPNKGSYTVGAVAYAPDNTVVTVSPAPASATVSGNLVFGPSNSTMLANLRLHHAEVSAAISASVTADGTSVNTDGLLNYLRNVVQPELAKRERALGGMFMAGQLKTYT
jgi:hypothetical protein